MLQHGIDRVEALPRLGWVEAPSPVESWSELAQAMGLDGLWVKRDDALGLRQGLFGGTKVRKLDVLLAAPPWRDAPRWASVGAIGSGHLVALSTAARLLDRSLYAHLFWEPPLPPLLENLAYVASGPCDLRYSDTRVGVGLRDLRLLLARHRGGAAVVPPGASGLLGQAGIVRGAIELKRQVEAGICPAPAHVFVPLGSGGTLVGLMVGMALVGLRCTLHGVAVVERIFSTEGGVRSRAKRLLAFLGVEGATLPTLLLHREQLGRGYGVPTAASQEECARRGPADLGLEPIYSGKAMAALRAAAPSLRGDVLFWLTPRTPGPLPTAPDWRDRLPPELRRRLDAAEPARRVTRRRILLGAGGALAGVGLLRFTGYPPPPAGLVTLRRDAAELLRAAVEVVIAPPPTAPEIADIVRRIDRFVATQPRPTRLQILGALALVEQCPLALSGRWDRFSELGRAERLQSLEALARRGGTSAEAARCVRDLSMLGHYQRPQSWSRLGYRGPWVGPEARVDAYAAFCRPGAPPGTEGAS